MQASSASQNTPRAGGTTLLPLISSGVWAPLLLALLVLLSRWPFRTSYLYNWEAANFALGTQLFNVGLQQPHPPGFPYFVGMGALLNLIFGDANAALVTVSVLLEVVAVVALYRFASLVFSEGAGLAAGLLLAASVSFWSYGEVALAYPALAAFGALTAYFAYQTAFLERPRLFACALTYAIGTGFHPNLALFLLPLLVIACWRQPPLRVVTALAIAFGGVLAWLIPTALLSGGPGSYWATLNAYWSVAANVSYASGGFGSYLAAVNAYLGGADSVSYAPAAQGSGGLLANLQDSAAYLFYALYAEALVVVTGLLLLLWKRPAGRDLWFYLFLAAWGAPMGLFYIFVHIGDPGNAFYLLPPVLLLGIGGWSRWFQQRSEQTLSLVVSGFALVLMANAFLFFLFEQPLTLSGLRTSDRAVGATLSYLSTYEPPEVLVLSNDSHTRFRYYLPEYPHLARVYTQSAKTQRVVVPEGVEWAVFTDPSVFALVQGLPAEAELLGDDHWAARLAVQPGQVLVYENGRIRVEQ